MVLPRSKGIDANPNIYNMRIKNDAWSYDVMFTKNDETVRFYLLSTYQSLYKLDDKIGECELVKPMFHMCI